jgi:hypothetical protein
MTRRGKINAVGRMDEGKDMEPRESERIENKKRKTASRESNPIAKMIKSCG